MRGRHLNSAVRGAGQQVLEAPLEPILQQVSRWLNLFEARSLPLRSGGVGSNGLVSGWLAPDGSDLRPPPRRSGATGAPRLLVPTPEHTHALRDTVLPSSAHANQIYSVENVFIHEGR